MAGDLSFQELTDRVSRSRFTLVAGMTDTGKSTLIRRLADKLPATVIDSDIGQSDMGPPSVVSLGRRERGNFIMEDGYFVGSVTPARHFLQLLAGVSRMAKKCKNYPVILNTSGLATGGIGRTLVTEKINAICPDLIIAIAKEDELTYLNAFRNSDTDVIFLKPGSGAREKSRAERNLLRAKAFREHFLGARTLKIKLSEIGIERSLINNGTRLDPSFIQHDLGMEAVYLEVSGDDAVAVFKDKVPIPEKLAFAFGTKMISAYSCTDFVNLLVGTMSRKGLFAGLGIVRSIDFKQDLINILTPAFDFSIVQFGTMKLDPVTFTSAGQFLPAFYRA